MRDKIIIGVLLTILCSQAFAKDTLNKKTSCFSGTYQNLDAFTEHVNHVHVRQGKGPLSDRVKEEIKRDYSHWQKIHSEEVSCHFFEYKVDGIPVTGFVLQPKKVKLEDTQPLIFNRGGNADLAMSTRYIFGRLVPIAQQGFLVIGSFYRGAKINGVPSEYRLKDEFGGQDVNDVLALLPIIDTYKGMKDKKVAMWGMSRGGMMAFLAAKKSKRFSTIIADSTPVDIVAEAEATDRMDKVFNTWIPNFKKRKTKALKERSVIYWHKELGNIPILLLHGSKDWRVFPENTLRFALELQKSKHPYELHMYEDAGHGLRAVELDVNNLIINWVRKHSS